MTSARDTYNASVTSATASKTATVIAAQTTFETTIDASKSVVGYTLQNGNFANLQASTTTANKALIAALQSAEAAKQAAIAAARDVLRAAGDYGPI